MLCRRASGRLAAQRPEAVRRESGVDAPEIVAGQVDVLPAERGDVSQQSVRNDLATAAQGVESPLEIDGVPEGDCGGNEREAARPMLLQRGGPVPEPAEPVKADGASERVAGFAFVELDRCLPTQVRLVQPVQREQRPLEAADLAQCQRQTVLARVR